MAGEPKYIESVNLFAYFEKKSQFRVIKTENTQFRRYLTNDNTTGA